MGRRAYGRIAHLDGQAATTQHPRETPTGEGDQVAPDGSCSRGAPPGVCRLIFDDQGVRANFCDGGSASSHTSGFDSQALAGDVWRQWRQAEKDSVPGVQTREVSGSNPGTPAHVRSIDMTEANTCSSAATIRRSGTG